MSCFGDVFCLLSTQMDVHQCIIWDIVFEGTISTHPKFCGKEQEVGTSENQAMNLK